MITDLSKRVITGAMATGVRSRRHLLEERLILESYLRILDSDQTIILGDFNIHVDDPSDCLGKAFAALLDDVGFTQSVNEPTHCHKHTLDLVLTHGIEISQLSVLPLNPIISDHFMITFQFTLEHAAAPANKKQLRRTLTDRSVSEFKFNSIQFNSIQFYLYSPKSQQQSSRWASK